MGENQHVVPENDNWAVKGAGNEKYTKIVNPQKQAIDITREIARNQKSELVIHKKMALLKIKIITEMPHPPKDTKF